MTFRIEQDRTERESFGNYTYRIYRHNKLVARYWHDYRGDEHGIDFINGDSEGWPVGGMIDFIKGGGPQPLVLSEAAVTYLKKKLEC